MAPYIRTRKSTPRAGVQVSYTPEQVAALYNFPKVPMGREQTIALIELGGGYDMEDIAAYFRQIHLPVPTVTSVSVDGAANNYSADPHTDAGYATQEVMLDIYCAAAAYSYSTGKPANIVVFFAPNTASGFPNAIRAAAKHSLKPSVCSISWGAPESAWTADAVDDMEDAFQKANAAGMTCFAAAGDNSREDEAPGNNADYPASSPRVVSCGGTSLTSHTRSIARNNADYSASSVQVAVGGSVTSLAGRIDTLREVAWTDDRQKHDDRQRDIASAATFGRVSKLFQRPAWQPTSAIDISRGLKMRGVPDISGNADPDTGYVVVIGGQRRVLGGTSAVAPLFAALFAVINSALNQRIGYVNAILYARPAAFRDIAISNDSGFEASQGWEPATGLGVPVGTAVLAAVRASEKRSKM